MDISIIKRRDRIFIVGISDAGKHWLHQNIDGNQRLSSIMVEMPAEVEKEFSDMLKAAGLEVD